MKTKVLDIFKVETHSDGSEVEFDDPYIMNLPILDKDYKVFMKTKIGLFIYVSARTGLKSWRMKYTILGRESTYVIGRFPDIKIGGAIDTAREIKKLVRMGIEPNRQKENDTIRHKKERKQKEIELRTAKLLKLVKGSELEVEFLDIISKRLIDLTNIKKYVDEDDDELIDMEGKE